MVGSAGVWDAVGWCRGCGKNWKSKGYEFGQNKNSVGKRMYFFFPGTNVFNGIFFQRYFFFGGVWNLKGRVFVYVPRIVGRKNSVKGALGVGGGGEE